MKDEDYFLQKIGEILPQLKEKMKAYCYHTKQEWDEDVFSDTIIKCYNAIQKKGSLNDKSDYGVQCYFFQSFSINIKREQQYSRNSKKDNSKNIFKTYEDWMENNLLTPIEKIQQDTYKDFATLYILTKAEQNNDAESFYLFNLKHLGGYTYKELQEKTHAKAIRQKVANVKRWIMNNVTKEEVQNAYEDFKAHFFE